MLLKRMAQWPGKYLFTRYFTVRKLLNLVRVSLEYAARRPSVKGRPYHVVVDPCNSCILHCPLCPTGQGSKARSKGMMRFDDYARLIDEVKPYAYDVYLFNWGEPLLNPDIFRMIEYAHNCGVRTRLSSNLNHFPDGYARKLVASGLDSLVISLDGTTQETYQTYRRGGSFQKVLDGIRMINEERKRQNSTTPRMVWQFLIMRHNEHEISRVHKMAGEIGVDCVCIGPAFTDTARLIFQNDAERIDGSREWLPRDDRLSVFDYAKKRRKTRTKRCKYLWTMPAIDPDGSLSPCCAVYPEKYDFGNVFQQSLSEIWNNEKYVASRRIVSGRKGHAATVCATCAANGFI